ncbi:MAG TPA: DUF4350 domain-containing protein [Planctomycetota bacterium]|nr:DUF4350 domain-containing protein [Planctomycetota bacterium]
MNPFRRRTTIILTAVAGVSFLALLLWGIFGPELVPARSSGADSFSRSALGHHAFVELLHELRVPVVVSRFNSGRKARDAALLVVLEPGIGGSETRRRTLLGMIGQADRTLIVLPKWRGIESEEDPGFIESAELVQPWEVEEVLRAIGADVNLVRVPPGDPVSWRAGEVGATPDIVAPQLLRGNIGGKSATCAQGVLLGRVSTPRGNVFILSDPDLLSNHGLMRPGNALATMGMLALARGEQDAVVIDETLHGFGKEPSLFRSLFEFPLGLATIQALFAAATLLWAAMGRFGAPHPAPPPHEAGKKALIGNIAALLAYGGHGAHALRRYLDGAVAEVRGALHVPAELKAAEAEARLDRAHGSIRLGDLRELVRKESTDRRHILAIARRVHRWREETIGGRIGHP